MLLWFALGCGGSVPLDKPHDPPAWPLENLHTRRPPEVPAAPVEPVPDDTDVPNPAPGAPAAPPEAK
jgi:hypothetical protein